MLFDLGQLVSTPGALAAFDKTGDDPLIFLARHLAGDWGDVCEEDARANNDAVEDGFRILSSYKLSDDTKIWIITERDRSVTTLLLPEEY